MREGSHNYPRRRRIRSTRVSLLSARIALFVTCVLALVLFTESGAEAAVEDIVGKVSPYSIYTTPTLTLTTRCDDGCGKVASTVACLRGISTLSACKDNQEMANTTCKTDGSGDSKSGGAMLCLSPDRKTVRLLFTNDPEMLALGRSGIAVDSEMGTAITINAADVRAIDAFQLPTATKKLFLRAAVPNEALAISITDDVIKTWKSLETLSVRNFDLSDVMITSSLSKLKSLDFASAKLTTWPIITNTPALSKLNLSSNALKSITSGALTSAISQLDLSNNKLQQLPDDIASLKALNKLSMSGNPLAKLSKVPWIKYLKDLSLSNAQLTSAPTGLSKLTMLETLDLSENTLAEIPGLPRSLVSLNLRNSSLSSIPSDFSQSKTWKFIDLSLNPFSDSTFKNVQFNSLVLKLESVGLTKVPSQTKRWAIGDSLSLSGNKLLTVDKDDLPPSINELHLSKCDLTEVPSNLKSLRRLTILDLDKNSFKSIPKNSLPIRLEKLSLSDCSLATVPADVVSMSKSLESLDLSANDIKAIDVEDFTNLKKLYLQDNSLQEIPSSVFKLPKLTHLDLRGNPIKNVILTAAQATFLSAQLREFAIDDAAFSSTLNCDEWTTFRGISQVCTRVGQRPDEAESAEKLASPEPGSGDSPPSRDEDAESIPAWKIINIFLACLIGAIFVISVLVCLRRSGLILPRSNAPSFLAPIDDLSILGAVEWEDDPELLQWRVDTSEVEPTMPVESGLYCVVWIARYKNENVTLKRLHDTKHDLGAFERFVEEIKVMSRLQHPKIVRFMGVSWTRKEDLEMLVEFMGNGDLQQFLATIKTMNVPRQWNLRKLSIAVDIIEALAHLHALHPPVLHRDLTSQHVLLDESFTAKVTDFGTCRNRDEVLAVSTVAGTCRWIAPEVLSGRGDFSEASDMYSFGVILSELDSEELPFSGIMLSNRERLSEVAILELLSVGALEPTASPQCPLEISQLMQACVSFDRRDRPTAQDALRCLEMLLDDLRASDLGH